MIKRVFLLLAFLVTFLSLSTKNAQAVVDCPFITNPPPPLSTPLTSITLKFDGSKIPGELSKYPAGGELKFSFPGTGMGSCGNPSVSDINNPTFSQTNDNNFLTRCDDDLLGGGQHKVEIIYVYAGQTANICNPKTYNILQTYPTCKVEALYSGLGDVDDSTWKIVVSDFDKMDFLSFPNTSAYVDSKQIFSTSSFGLSGSKTADIPSAIRTAGSHSVRVYAMELDWAATAGSGGIPGYKKGPVMCSAKFEIAPRGATPKPTASPMPTPTPPPQCSSAPCNTGDCSAQCSACPGCPEAIRPTLAFIPETKPLCDQLDINYRDKCTQCVSDGKHMWTAIGCIPTDFTAIIRDYIFKTGVGIAGGIAFLYFLYGAFIVLTSAGNPEKIEEAKQIITSSLAGLLLIIFSVFLLGVIGVDVLGLPGFGKS